MDYDWNYEPIEGETVFIALTHQDKSERVKIVTIYVDNYELIRENGTYDKIYFDNIEGFKKIITSN